MPAYFNEKTKNWYCHFRYTEWTGERKDKKKCGFKTKRDAVKWEADFKARLAGEMDMNFEEFVKVYEEERFPRLKPTTKVMKESIINMWILPYFKNKMVQEITSRDIIRWQNVLLEKIDPKTDRKYSKSYLKTIHNQISAIFNYACRYYQLRTNPAAVAGNMGDESDLKLHYWTLEQYRKFSEEMMNEPRFYYAFEVLYWLGIREGELFALTKADFDFEKKTVCINKNYQMLRGEALILTPKTQKGERTILVPDFLCEELQDYFEKIPYVKDNERIFFGISKSMMTRHIKQGAKRAGLPEIRVHDLRHSHVSLLIDMGFNAVQIADRVGHESVEITYRYAHLFPSAQQDMASRLNDLEENKGKDCRKDKDDEEES